MNILSHRGYWHSVAEKNTAAAFHRSFAAGFGTETDVRDYQGRLVIAHDPPTGDEMLFEEFLHLHSSYDAAKLPLAINIKADGLAAQLKALLKKYNATNYFCFDMAVPDALSLLKDGLCCFTRHSEVESVPAFYEAASGIWMDSFYSDWIEAHHIFSHIQAGKQVCIVSPELHKRPYLDVWGRYKVVDLKTAMLCTDIPEEAKEFFGV
jgi:hypothetical protein